VEEGEAWGTRMSAAFAPTFRVFLVLSPVWHTWEPSWHTRSSCCHPCCQHSEHNCNPWQCRGGQMSFHRSTACSTVYQSTCILCKRNRREKAQSWSRGTQASRVGLPSGDSCHLSCTRQIASTLVLAVYASFPLPFFSLLFLRCFLVCGASWRCVSSFSFSCASDENAVAAACGVCAVSFPRYSCSWPRWHLAPRFASALESC